LPFHRDCDNTVLLSESFEIFTEVFLHIPVSNHCNLFCKYERESLWQWRQAVEYSDVTDSH
jgi:hypothetical protein